MNIDLTGTSLRPTVLPDQHENLQCFQCFITFCSAKAKERHMKKSHREEYKQQLQQVRSYCNSLLSPSDVLTQQYEGCCSACCCSMMCESYKKVENRREHIVDTAWLSTVHMMKMFSATIFSGEHAIHVLCVWPYISLVWGIDTAPANTQ